MGGAVNDKHEGYYFVSGVGDVWLCYGLTCLNVWLPAIYVGCFMLFLMLCSITKHACIKAVSYSKDIMK